MKSLATMCPGGLRRLGFLPPSLWLGSVALALLLAAGGTPPFRFIEGGNVTLEVSNLSFENGLFNSTLPGALQSGGGAIFWQGGRLELRFTDFLFNTIDIGRGGAVFARNVDVELLETRFLGNEALVTDGNHGGGGLAVVDGSLLAERCAFVDNNADATPGSPASGGIGGALLIEGTVGGPAPFDMVATVLHSTLSGNTANSSGAMALIAQSGPTAEVLLVLDYVTLVRNDAMVLSDGVGLKGTFNNAFAVYSNSILHSNGSLLPDGTYSGDDCQVNLYNAFSSGLGNLLGTGGECPADFFDDFVTPRLATDLGVTLAFDHHPPVLGSVVVDNAVGGSCTPGQTMDQRRKVRGNGEGAGGAACDIGAIELYGPTALIFSDGFESGDTSAWTLAVP